jgi:hypothetical protein
MNPRLPAHSETLSLSTPVCVWRKPRRHYSTTTLFSLWFWADVVCELFVDLNWKILTFSRNVWAYEQLLMMNARIGDNFDSNPALTRLTVNF